MQMTNVQVQAAVRLKAELTARTKERDRDLLYLRQAGSKGIAV